MRRRAAASRTGIRNTVASLPLYGNQYYTRTLAVAYDPSLSGFDQVTSGELGLPLGRPLKLISAKLTLSVPPSAPIAVPFRFLPINEDGQETNGSRTVLATVGRPVTVTVHSHPSTDYRVISSNGDTVFRITRTSITGASSANFICAVLIEANYMVGPAI